MRKHQRLYAAPFLLFLLTFYSLSRHIVNGEEEEEKEDFREHVEARIERRRLATAVSFSDVDFESSSEPSLMAEKVAKKLTQTALQPRLEKLFAKAETPECREKIATHFSYFINAIGMEESLPFTDVKFRNDCPEPAYMWSDLPEDMHPGDLQNRTYQPPRNESEYLDDEKDLLLCFGILAHSDPNAVIRLIETLHEPGHVFVLHVDGKEIYEDTQVKLQEYASKHEHVHILDHPHRVRINWGGFSMVNATLQMLQYAMGVGDHGDALDFHRFVHLSQSSYPIASNKQIRHRLASFPLDANFVHVIMQPTRGSNAAWHYFIECDDALHRIYQLQALNSATSNAEVFTSSQWFIISREFAGYLANPEPGSFASDYLKYVEHVVVADESFFGTVLRNSEYCVTHHNRHFLHLQFDRWESELPAGKRDERKCPMPNPDHCGRSPTLMTLDYADILELSDELFARKFDDTVDGRMKDIVDAWRSKREESDKDVSVVNIEYEGHGVLIVAKETVNGTEPLCLGLGSSGNTIKLVPCFHKQVPPTLGPMWETGGVIQTETPGLVRWELGPCTTDGNASRNDTGYMEVTPGNYSPLGPRCMLKQMDGIRAGRCYDGHPDSLQPGGSMQVYPCVHQWYQFVSFGDGITAPSGSLFSIIPSHIVRQIKNLGHDQHAEMCFGVWGRHGNEDEIPWGMEMKDEATRTTSDNLSEWAGEDVILTQCSNREAVIEWVFVPYIVEDDDDNDADDSSDQSSVTSENEAETCEVASL